MIFWGKKIPFGKFFSNFPAFKKTIKRIAFENACDPFLINFLSFLYAIIPVESPSYAHTSFTRVVCSICRARRKDGINLIPLSPYSKADSLVLSQTRCVCETQIPTITPSKDGQYHQNKYFDTFRKTFSQEMTMYNMEALLLFFSTWKNWSNFKIKRLKYSCEISKL